MNPNNRQGQATAAQRVARAMHNPNDPTACRKCGSIYFMEISAQMYTMGGYGVRSVSTTPMKVYMCPCGEILTPAGLNTGVQAGGERDLFAQSLAAALAYRAENGVDAAAKGFAGVHELRELKAQVDDLQARINLLCDEIEPTPAAETTGSGDSTEDDGMPPAQNDRPAAVEPSLPVSRGPRGRSEAGATEASGDIKYVQPPQRPVVEGGARGRMRRQGGQ